MGFFNMRTDSRYEQLIKIAQTRGLTAQEAVELTTIKDNSNPIDYAIPNSVGFIMNGLLGAAIAYFKFR